MTNIVVIGTPAQQALVTEGLDKATIDIDGKLRNPYRIEFHTTAEFVAKGYVFANGRVNWGRVVGARVLWVNGTICQRRPYRGVYVSIHELGHAMDSDWNTASKHAELVKLMPTVPAGTGWRKGAYLNRPSEIYADAFVEAVMKNADSFHTSNAPVEARRELDQTIR